MRKWIGFFLLFAFSANVLAQPQTESEGIKENTIKDYFQPMLISVKYQYSERLNSLFSGKITKPLKKPAISYFVEFIKGQKASDGKIDSVYYFVPTKNNYTGWSMDLLRNYSIDEESIKYTATQMVNSKEDDLQSQIRYEEENGKIQACDEVVMKMPKEDVPAEWVNVDDNGGTLSLKAYFGKCETLKDKYPDCIIVEEKREDQITTSYYAKSIGLVKQEIYGMDVFKKNDFKNPKFTELYSSIYLSKIITDDNFTPPDTSDIESFVNAGESGEHGLYELGQVGNFIGYNVNGNVQVIQKIDDSDYLIDCETPGYTNQTFYLTNAKTLNAVDNQFVHVFATVVGTKSYQNSFNQNKTVFMLKLRPSNSYQPIQN